MKNDYAEIRRMLTEWRDFKARWSKAAIGFVIVILVIGCVAMFVLVSLARAA